MVADISSIPTKLVWLYVTLNRSQNLQTSFFYSAFFILTSKLVHVAKLPFFCSTESYWFVMINHDQFSFLELFQL